MTNRSKPGRAPIDHGRLIDSFGERMGQREYVDREGICARCGARYPFGAAAQKYVHEQHGVPVSLGERAGLCPACRVSSRKRAQGSGERARLLRTMETARAAAAAQPAHGGLLLEYAVARLRLLEQSWSLRSAQLLLGELRRVARLDASLDKPAAKRAAELRELIAAHTQPSSE